MSNTLYDDAECIKCSSDDFLSRIGDDIGDELGDESGMGTNSFRDVVIGEEFGLFRGEA